VRLVLTGGGTGGHVYPALALAEAFAGEATFAPLAVSFIGTRDRMEARIVPQAGLPMTFVHAAPLVRAVSFDLFATLFANARGFFEALAVLHRVRPDVLIATGGYVTLPVVAALRAVRLLGRSHAKIALLEPNARAGLTNRLLGPLADEVWYGVRSPGLALAANEHVVGTPVRASLRRALDAGVARTALGLDPARTTLVVFGGSQGARSLNEAVAGFALAGLPADLQILVVAGTNGYAPLHERLQHVTGVRVLTYLDDPHAAYAAADVVLSRAGASTLAELAATATPAVLVPYPHATDDHQAHNARAFAADGAALVVPDTELDATRLRALLAAVLEPAALRAMRAAARARAASDPCAAIVARVKTWSFANHVDP
jgi:UDP-N-acetylglucosamine--N-acetylmuramyl-(pentapeptide) pyrophosphoryl-undecaprenol N-acetylglucosamine transferase